MTLLQVKNQLVSFFLSHDSFEFVKDQLEFTFEKDSIDMRETMLRACLNDFETLGLVKRLVFQDRDIWVLVQPIHAYIQKVEIGPMVAEALANSINYVNEMQGIEGHCDKLKLVEDDILRLIGIVEEGIEVAMQREKSQATKPPGQEN